jgi:outer membrane protein assembly factor BamD
MQIVKTHYIKHNLLILLLLLASGCAGAEVKKELTAEELYLDAMEEFNKGKAWGIFSTIDYVKVIEKFQRVIDYYPVSKYAVLAELRIADAYFRNREYHEAIFRYQEFQRHHPANENIPYVLYQLGLSYYKLILSIDRDQSATQKAISRFEELIRKYPDCEYAEDAREKLMSCRRRLAEYEFYVGRFYYRKGDYQVALGRFGRILKDYPDSGLVAKALYFIGLCHYHLKEWDEAREALRRLNDLCPRSKYRKKAENILAELKD